MVRLFWEAVIVIVWIALTVDFSLLNIALGALLGVFLLWYMPVQKKSLKYFLKLPKVFIFIFYFFWELIVANIRVAYYVLSPLKKAKPGIVAIPLRLKKNWQITVLANVITLTPGTLSIDVSNDKKTLYIHVISMKSADEVRKEIRDGLEQKLLEATK